MNSQTVPDSPIAGCPSCFQLFLPVVSTSTLPTRLLDSALKLSTIDGMSVMTIDSPWGRLGVYDSDDHIVALRWHVPEASSDTPLLVEAIAQLTAYIEGSLTQFDLPLRPSGSAFQQRVCQQMLAIPYGETRTYGDIASSLGSMPQPVGQACGGNSIPIIIPCHRVLGADGIGGFSGAGGIETKISLLQHEDGFPFLL